MSVLPLVAEGQSPTGVPVTLDGGRGLAELVRTQRPTAVVLDFDETLWLRNSTETYLASLRPRPLAVLLLSLLNVLRPWRMLPGDRQDFLYRDWIRVLVLSVLMPWGLLAWRYKAPALGAQHLNHDLVRAVAGAAAPRIHVVTFGFRPVVGPLLHGTGTAARLTVACGLLDGFRVRARGKRACVEQALGEATVRTSLVVTDSADDADLLDACRTPVLTRWPGARFEAAFADSYLPFLYTSKGKRPGQRYLLHHVLLEDVVVLWLAFAWLMAVPPAGMLALLGLHASFWLVYEIGYHENDHVAVLGEENPVLPAGATAVGHRMHRGAAWGCALLLGLAAVTLLTWQAPEAFRWNGHLAGWTAHLVGCAAWVGYLLVGRGSYWVYNRLEVLPRGYWYLALQLTRSLGYGALLVTSWPGAALLTAFALSRWIPYLTYREVGEHWRTSNRTLFLVIYLLLLGAGAAASVAWWSWQALVVAAWLVLRTLSTKHRLVPAGQPWFQATVPRG